MPILRLAASSGDKEAKDLLRKYEDAVDCKTSDHGKGGGVSMSNDIVALSEKCGRCERCHRKLKDPESMKRGLGPICAKKVEAELKEDGKKEVQAK